MSYNDKVTLASMKPSRRVTPECQIAATSGASSGLRARLEDVEKIVRNHDRELEDLIDTVAGILNALDAACVSLTAIQIRE